MNEKNTDYLKDQLKYHGFGERLYPEMESQMAKGAAEFSLAYKTELNKREIEATLHFRKSDTTDMYFFNRYDVKTKNEKENEAVSQTFYMSKGNGITLKEAYNLLNGRAVHKELTDKNDQKYQAWVQLDFSVKDKNGNFERKQYHQNYGYDIREALSYFPIKELGNEEDKKALIRSLEKGNVQQVTVQANGTDVKVFLEANPQFKNLTIYNNQMQRMDAEKRQELMQKPAIQEESQGKTKGKELTGEGKPEKKQDKGRKMSGSGEQKEKGLVTKKRESSGKKMGL